MAVTLSQTYYRFGLDDGTESAHGWYAAENAPASLPLDTNCLLRINVQESGGSTAPNLVQQFQYALVGVGPYTNITTTSNYVRAVAVGAFANGDNCTKRLSGTGTFEASGAGCTEDGSSGGNANDLSANGCTETELGFQLRSADLAPGTAVYFRLDVSGPTTNITYTVTPTAHVKIDEAPTVGATVVTGQTPSRIVNHLAAAALAALAFTGTPPTIAVAVPNTTIPVGAGAIAVSGVAPKIPTLTATLKEGATVRATRYVNLTNALATSEFALESGEASAIENWSALTVSLVANSGQAEVSWAELEMPEGETAFAESPGAGTLALSGLQPTAYTTIPGPTLTLGTGTLAVSGASPSLPSFTVELRVGTDLVATRSLNLYGGLETHDLALDADTEAPLITDWSTLRVSLIANVQQVEVSWAELQTPEAADAFTFTPAVAALALASDAPSATQDVILPQTASPSAGTLTFNGMVPPTGEVSLYMGASATGTRIATRALQFTDALATYAFTLTDTEFAAITDWSDLHVVITADGPPLVVSWLALEAGERGTFPTAGSLTFSGLSPLPFADAVDAEPTGAMAFAGAAPTTSRTFLATPGPGALVVASDAPSPVGVADPPVGSLAFAGTTPTIATDQPNISRTALVGTLTLAGLAPSALQAITVTPTDGALSFAGLAPTTTRTYLMLPAVRALVLSGPAPSIFVTSDTAIVVTPEEADLVFGGTTPTITQAAVGPLALAWGTERLVVAGCVPSTLVPARITGDTLEYIA